MKHLFLACAATVIFAPAVDGRQPAVGQKPGVSQRPGIDDLQKARDYLDGKVTYWMLSKKQQVDSLGRANLSSLKALDTADPRNAETPDQMEARMKAQFGSTILKVTRPIASIDVKPYAALPADHFAQKLTDTAVTILTRAYGPAYSPPATDRDEWQHAMVNFLEPAPVPRDSALLHSAAQVPPRGAGPFSKFFTFSFWDLVLVLACVALGYFARKHEQSLRALRRPTRSDLRRDHYDDKIGDLNAAIGRLQGKVTNLEEKLARSQEGQPERGRYQEQRPERGAATRPRDPDLRPRQSAPLPGAVTPPDNIFYMTFPVGNYFMVRTQSATSDNTIYQFVRKGPQEAEFSVHASGAALQDILSMAQDYLRPACNEENLPRPGIKSIKTLSPGRAILEEDRWIIKTKAFIRYE